MSSKRRRAQNSRKVSVSASEGVPQSDYAAGIELADAESASESGSSILDRLMNAQRCPKRLRGALNEYANAYADRPILAAVLYCDRLMSDISQEVVNAFFSKDTANLKRMSGDMSYLASQLRTLSSAMTYENLSNSQVHADSFGHVFDKIAEVTSDASDEESRDSDTNDVDETVNSVSIDAGTCVDDTAECDESTTNTGTGTQNDDGEDNVVNNSGLETSNAMVPTQAE